MPQTLQSWTIRTLAEEYKRYAEWARRRKIYVCPIADYYKGLVEAWDLDVALIRAACDR